VKPGKSHWATREPVLLKTAQEEGRRGEGRATELIIIGDGRYY